MPAALLTAVLFALTGVCAAQASRLLGAGRANVWRLVIALAVLGIWAHGWGPGIGGRALPWFLLAGGIGFGLGGWCALQALRRVGSTLTLLIVECAAAVFATAIGWGWLGAALRPQELLFAGLILIGVMLGMTPGPIPALRRELVLGGCALAATSAIFQALSINLSRHAFTVLKTAGETLPPLGAAYHRLLGGCAVALLVHALACLVRRGVPAAPQPDAHAAPFPDSPLPAPVWVVLNALCGPVLGVTCMLWAISTVANPGLVQAVAASATLLTVPLARRLEAARPGIAYFSGCALALGGIAGLLLGV
jgi:drug/metabolite transporter (DMT)-like permease